MIAIPRKSLFFFFILFSSLFAENRFKNNNSFNVSSLKKQFFYQTNYFQNSLSYYHNSFNHFLIDNKYLFPVVTYKKNSVVSINEFNQHLTFIPQINRKKTKFYLVLLSFVFMTPFINLIQIVNNPNLQTEIYINSTVLLTYGIISISLFKREWKRHKKKNKII